MTMLQGMSVVRVEELDTCTPDILSDPNRVIWGVVEVDGKTYKYSIRDQIASADYTDKRVTALIERVNQVETDMEAFVDGVDENVVIEP